MSHIPAGLPLPDIDSESFVLHWDHDRTPFANAQVKFGDRVILEYQPFYEDPECFVELCAILKHRYGDRIKDLIPTGRSHLYLPGDHIHSAREVDQGRKRVFGVDSDVLFGDRPVPILPSQAWYAPQRMREYRMGYPQASEANLKTLMAAEDKLGRPAHSLAHAKDALGILDAELLELGRN